MFLKMFYLKMKKFSKIVFENINFYAQKMFKGF